MNKKCPNKINVQRFFLISSLFMLKHTHSHTPSPDFNPTPTSTPKAGLTLTQSSDIRTPVKWLHFANPLLFCYSKEDIGTQCVVRVRTHTCAHAERGIGCQLHLLRASSCSVQALIYQVSTNPEATCHPGGSRKVIPLILLCPPSVERWRGRAGRGVGVDEEE